MGKTLSLDLRERVVGAVEDGASCRAAAGRFGVAASTAIRWVRRWRERGSLAAGTRGGNRRSHRIDAHRNTILGLTEAEPDLTLVEIGERLEATTGYRPARSVGHEFFVRHAVTRKKKTGHAAEKERDDVKLARQAFFAGQDVLDPTRLFFVDETGTSTKMASTYGRAPRGERCRAAVPTRASLRAAKVATGKRQPSLTRSRCPGSRHP